MLIGHAIEILTKFELSGVAPEGGEYYLKTAYFVAYHDVVRGGLRGGYPLVPAMRVGAAIEVGTEYMRMSFPRCCRRIQELTSKKDEEAIDAG